MATRIGIDVGGTFTDLIMLDEESGKIEVGKGPSDPAAVDRSVRGVLSATVDRSAVEQAGYFLHGTTVGLNALLERKGARVGLLTTDGFRDVLEIRRLLRVDEHGDQMWDHLFKTPDPLVPRPLRLGVHERVLADGSVREALEREAVREAAATFAREGVECVAVVFLNSHANPAHELEAAALLREAGFAGPVSLSHQVSGQYREYERASTTVVDAYVRPAVSGYLETQGRIDILRTMGMPNWVPTPKNLRARGPLRFFRKDWSPTGGTSIPPARKARLFCNSASRGVASRTTSLSLKCWSPISSVAASLIRSGFISPAIRMAGS